MGQGGVSSESHPTWPLVLEKTALVCCQKALESHPEVLWPFRYYDLGMLVRFEVHFNFFKKKKTDFYLSIGSTATFAGCFKELRRTWERLPFISVTEMIPSC